MPNSETDIAIVGAGPVGLMTALTIARQTEFNIVLIGQRLTPAECEKDARTTAFMRSSLNLLENIGILSECSASSAPLKALRLIDDTGSLFRSPDCFFNASELGLEAFAENIQNADLLKALIAKTVIQPQITWNQDSPVTDIEPGEDSVRLTCGENKILNAKLCIGADGAKSICRTAAGIKSRSWKYDQIAIACSFTHTKPHNGVSTEFHRDEGPLTLIPLREYHSSLVWSHKPHKAKLFAELQDDEFAAQLQQATKGVLGEIKEISDRGSFPISCLTAETFAKNRIALVGEAAHTLPPIGAQGLNLGVRDCAHLAFCLETSKNGSIDPGRLSILNDYNKARRFDIWSRTAGTDLLNKSLLSTFLPFKAMRYTGLHLLNNLSPLRKIVMQEGIGATKNPVPLLADPANQPA